MILLEKIILKNFLSHDHTEVDFKNEQRLLIDGVSGSGKSSIVEGLVWCLYNKGRADNRDLVRKGSKYTEVSVTLSNEQEHYRIDRKATIDGKHELSILYREADESYTPLGVVGIKPLQEYIEKQILHSSYLLFVNSVVYPQNNEDSFIKQTAANRKDILLEMANASDVDEYLKKTKSLISAKTSETDTLQGSIYSLNNWLAQAKQGAVDVLELKRSSSTTQAAIDALLAQKSANDVLLNEKIELSASLKSMPIEIANIEKAIALVGSEDPQLDIDLLESKYQKDLATYNMWREADKKLIEEYHPRNTGDLDEQINEINQSLINIELSQRNGEWICPQCKLVTPLSEIHSDSDQPIKKLEEMLINLKQRKAFQDKNNELYDRASENLGMCPPLPEVNQTHMLLLQKKLAIYSSLPEQKKRLSALNKSAEDILSRIHKVNELYLPELDDNISDLKTKKAVLEQKIDEAELRNKDIQATELLLQKDTERISVLSEEVGSLQYLRDAFSPNGITAMVVDFLVPQLEEKVNNILQKLSDFRVRFDTQKKGAGKDTVLEGLFITVINDQGQELDFDLYSGGEKLRIIVAISEALSEVQKIGFRVLDEAFVGLDQSSVEGFVEVIEELSTRFSQLICISHMQDIKDTFNETLLITKNNGISTVHNRG